MMLWDKYLVKYYDESGILKLSIRRFNNDLNIEDHYNINVSDNIMNWSRNGKYELKDVAMLAINHIISSFFDCLLPKSDNPGDYYTVIYYKRGKYHFLIKRYDNKEQIKTDVDKITSELDILLNYIEVRGMCDHKIDDEVINKFNEIIGNISFKMEVKNSEEILLYVV